MKRIEPDCHQSRRCIVVLAVLVLMACVMFIYPRAISIEASGEAAAQQQRRRRTPTSNRARRRPQSSRRRGIDYSRFFHNNNNHVKYDRANRANCSSCHTLSSPLQYDVKDYPDHPSCVGCHRQQFFTGARPPICTVCHRVSSPRDDRRYVFPRPGNDMAREFPGRFPHGLHQDLLARERPLRELFGEARHARASFTPSSADVPAQENCATCHASYDKAKKGEEGFFPGAGWPDNMLPGVSTFRKVPDGREGHRTCFVCHASSEKGWKSPSPVANDCAGCHSKAAPAGRASAQQGSSPGGTMTTARVEAPPVRVSFTSVLLPPRKVLTFQHEGGGAGGSHMEGCTTCHINITQEQTLVVKPDVPITSCALCHIAGGKKSSLKKGTDTTITSEMEAWISSRKACISCHTIEIGNRPPPCSHYYADRRVPPANLQCR